MEEQRTLPGVIARGKELLRGGGPDREGEASDDAIQAFLAPALPGGEQNGRVGKFGGTGEREIADEIVAVVEADVGDQAGGAVGGPERLPVEPVFGQQMHHVAAQGDRVMVPFEGAIGSVDRLRGHHGCKRVLRGWDCWRHAIRR